jgi:SAM-dependent methyltransferase
VDKGIKIIPIDLQWDDDHVLPEVVYPDVTFLFEKMNQATIETVAAKHGEIVLDIGFGRAGDGIKCAEKGAAVIGIDASEVMLTHAREYVNGNGANVTLVHGAGEYLPFKSGSIDKVLCKGALDHFAEPEIVIAQIARVLKEEGQAIIALANFESLGFKLGRAVYWLKSLLGFKEGRTRMPWEPPPDHTCKFDYFLLSRLASEHLQVDKKVGVSLLFGIPWWGQFLAKCPKKLTSLLLAMLDRAAFYFPSLSDVVVLSCSSKNGLGAK